MPTLWSDFFGVGATSSTSGRNKPLYPSGGGGGGSSAPHGDDGAGDGIAESGTFTGFSLSSPSSPPHSTPHHLLDLCESGESNLMVRLTLRLPATAKAEKLILRSSPTGYILHRRGHDATDAPLLLAVRTSHGFDIYGSKPEGDDSRAPFHLRHAAVPNQKPQWICEELVQQYSRQDQAVLAARRTLEISHGIKQLQKGVYYNCARLEKPADSDAAAAYPSLLYSPTKRPVASPSGQRSVTLSSKRPRWDSKTGGLTLKFSNPAIKAAHRNIQIQTPPDFDEASEGVPPPPKVCCEFGLTQSGVFALDVAYPMSILDAFCLALSTEAWEVDG